jgi:hypothetical protein
MRSQRHGGIVPGRAVVSFRRHGRDSAIDQAGDELCGLGRGKWRDVLFESEQAGEQSVEPGPLLRREWRRLRDK